MQNCGSQNLKVHNRSSATFFSLQLRNRFGCSQYCGVVEVRTKIADAQLWCVHIQRSGYRHERLMHRLRNDAEIDDN